MTANRFPKLATAELTMTGEGRSYRVRLCMTAAKSTAQYLETEVYLHPKERSYYRTLQFEKRIQSYLAGRYAAKHAVSMLLPEEHLEQICVDRGVFHHPVLKHPRAANLQVSITHVDRIGGALAFPEELPMGIDIERIQEAKKQVLSSQMTSRELQIIRTLPHSEEAMLTMLWTCKEALSKVLKTGLTASMHLFEISHCVVKDGFIHSRFQNFAQYATASMLAGDYVCSITYPQRVTWRADEGQALLADMLRLMEG